MHTTTPKQDLATALSVTYGGKPTRYYLHDLIVEYLPKKSAEPLHQFVQDFLTICEVLASDHQPQWLDYKGNPTDAPNSATSASVRNGSAQVRVFQGIGSTMRANIERPREHDSPVQFLKFLDCTPYRGDTMLSDIARNTIYLAALEGLRQLIRMADDMDGITEDTVFARLMCFEDAFHAAPNKGWSRDGGVQTWGTKSKDAAGLTVAIDRNTEGGTATALNDQWAFHHFKAAHEWRSQVTRKELVREAIAVAFNQVAKDVAGTDPRYIKGGDPLAI